MRGVNRVILIGNLGKEPDMQYIEGNIPVAKFPLATTDAYKDRHGNMVSQTEWHTVVLWRGLADLAGKFLHKGSLVYIEGKIRNRSWEDRDKRKHFSTEILADNMIMLDRKKENNGDYRAAVPAAAANENPVKDDTTSGNATGAGIAGDNNDDIADDLGYNPNGTENSDNLPF